MQSSLLDAIGPKYNTRIDKSSNASCVLFLMSFLFQCNTCIRGENMLSHEIQVSMSTNKSGIRKWRLLYPLAKHVLMGTQFNMHGAEV